jgi:uncharacterized damage-inducible protein DinB
MDAAVIDAYEASGKTLRRAVDGLGESELKARPGPGLWSILEVVVHLTDSDMIAIDRMKRIVIEDNPPLLYADETAYVDKLSTHDQSLDDALVLFEVGRRQWARVLRRLLADAFDRAGTHNRKGRVTLGEMVQSYVDHVDYHVRFIRDKRERLNNPAR